MKTRRRTIDLVSRARAIVAKGYTLREAAGLLRIRDDYLRKVKRQHPGIWNAPPDLGLAADIAPRGELVPPAPRQPRQVVVVVEAPPEPKQRRKVNPLVEEAIRRVGAMLAAGKTMEQAAKAVGRSRETLKTWQKTHASIWQAAQDIAMATAAVLIQKDPHAAASDVRKRVVQLRKLEAWCEVRGQTLLPNGKGETLMGFFDRFYRLRRLLNRSMATIDDYRSTIRFFGRFLMRTATVADLTDDNVSGFLDWTIGRGRSPFTANKQRATLHALWRAARRSKLIEGEPTIEKIATEKRVPEAWSLSEFARILDAASRVPGLVGDVPAADWWRALLITAYDTGLRISPLLHAELANLDQTEGWLRVKASTQKQKAEQAFKLHAHSLTAIAKILRPDAKFLFPWPYDPKRRVWRTLNRHYRAILKAAGVNTTARDLFHKVRRTTATYLADQAGAAVAQAYLGHSCASVTAAYLDPTKIRALRATDLLPRPEALISESARA